MRLASLTSLILLPYISLAAKQDTESSRFELYHSKSSSHSPLKLDDSIYNDLTKPHRDYSLVVLLTALEARFGCQLCKDFQPEWDIIGKSWTKGDRQGESRVLFGTLDFTDGKMTFQKVCCHL